MYGQGQDIYPFCDAGSRLLQGTRHTSISHLYPHSNLVEIMPSQFTSMFLRKRKRISYRHINTLHRE